jgi:3-dehydroquinate synthase/shikimate kinase/3-dehydroquinate synthase
MRRRTTRRASSSRALAISLGRSRCAGPESCRRRDEHGAHPLRAAVEGVLHGAGRRGGEDAGRRRAALGELELGRDGTLLAFGGGSTTDVAGFAAATYLRGVDWIAVPTTLSAWSTRRSAGRRESTPTRARTSPAPSTFRRSSFIDQAYLATLPDAERRAGMAEVVKTGLLAGREVWSSKRKR